jgi:hypothetical protein
MQRDRIIAYFANCPIIAVAATFYGDFVSFGSLWIKPSVPRGKGGAISTQTNRLAKLVCRTTESRFWFVLSFQESKSLLVLLIRRYFLQNEYLLVLWSQL